MTTESLLQTVSLENIHTTWAKADHWPLEDAVNLLLGLKPRLFEGSSNDEKAEVRRALVRELALNCLGDSLDQVMLKAAEKEPTVRPLQFLEWARHKGIEPPETLFSAVIDERERGPLVQEPKELAPKQRHRERSRAVAAMIWAAEPTLTKGEVARRREIKELGCQGQSYRPETIEKWIKEENPNRQPGRRPRKR